MEYIYTAVFFLIWITSIIAFAFSIFLMLRVRSLNWRNFSFFYAVLNIMLFFQFIQFYLQSSLPLESVLQLNWFGIHSDVSFILCLSLTAAFHTMLEVPFRKTGNRVLIIIIILLALLKLNPYLVRLFYGKFSYFISLPFPDDVFIIFSAVYNFDIFIFFYGRLKLIEQKQSVISLVVLLLFLYLDHFFILWRLYFNPLDTIMNWVNLLFYIIWNSFFLVIFIRSVNKIPDNLLNVSLEQSFVQKYNLTGRETEIAEMLIQGKSNGFISEKLFISIRTVKNHIYKIYQKTGVKNRIEMAYLIKKFGMTHRKYEL